MKKLQARGKTGYLFLNVGGMQRDAVNPSVPTVRSFIPVLDQVFPQTERSSVKSSVETHLATYKPKSQDSMFV
jgi:hypothetical protein